MGVLALLLWLWQTDVTPVTSALRENRFSSALELTKLLLVDSPRDAQLWALQGLAHAGLREQAEALGDFRQAVLISPDYLPALKGEAQIEYATHDEKCVRTLNHIVTLEPADTVSRAMLAAVAYQRKDCPVVVANYSVSEAVISLQSPALTEYGQCLFEGGKRDKAVEVFQQAVTLESSSWQPRYNLAVANLLMGRAADALAAVEPIVASGQPQVLDIASSAYEQIGDTPSAVQILRQAIVINPTTTFLYLHFADLCFAHISFQVGIDMINAGLQKLPNSALLYLSRGVLSVQLGAYADAESDFARAAQLDPSQSYSSVAQGLTQLQKSNLDGALAITRTELKQNPKDAYLHYVKAETLRQKGAEPGTAEFREAVVAAESAVRLKLNFSLAQDLLGTLYLRQDKPAQAVQQFRDVIGTEPNNESALYHLIVASRKTGETAVIPALMKRLVQAKAANKEKDERTNRYTFVEPSRN